MEKLKKIFNRQLILYMLFGGLTTIVNISVCFIFKSLLHVEDNISNTLGIIASILFAYFTNSRWVFNSEASTLKERFIEFSKFTLGRGVTMVLEIIGFFLLNSVFHLFYNVLGDNMAFLVNKCIITVIVIILNFFISKFFAFKNCK